MNTIYIFPSIFRKMMKMNFHANPVKRGPGPTIKPITIPVQSHINNNTSYPFSSLIERLRATGPCSSCGGK